MALTRYLVDTSAFTRFDKPVVYDVLEPLIRQRRLSMCAAVEFELRYSARNLEELRSLADELLSFPKMPINEAILRRALDVQELLAATGKLRALSLVDLSVAAAAEINELVVLHYDSDFDLIANVTGQKCEWVVERGTAE